MSQTAIVLFRSLLEVQFIHAISIDEARILLSNKHKIKVQEKILLFENLQVERFFYKDIDCFAD